MPTSARAETASPRKDARNTSGELIRVTHMKTASLSALFARIDAAEYGICRRMNRGASHIGLRNTFRVASRLGDGVIWYAMVASAACFFYGRAAIKPVLTAWPSPGCRRCAPLQSAEAGLRSGASPSSRTRSISLAMPPLDRYSFPSGHTLHAVSFAWQAVVAVP